MTATGQVAQSTDSAKVVSKSPRGWVLPASILSAFIVATVCLLTLGRGFLVETVHPFQVTQIDFSAHTMTLMHGKRTYVVKCEARCENFKLKGLYRMSDSGATLEYLEGGEKSAFPIIEEHTDFDVTGGHG